MAYYMNFILYEPIPKLLEALFYKIFLQRLVKLKVKTRSYILQDHTRHKKKVLATVLAWWKRQRPELVFYSQVGF